ncbi:hypothetical protein ABIB25_002804 [Nakamurella sp. UYEF19]|uniref:allophanate hydrolase-related protein n=1 Tax=Nakamurella sp. UYEF19 TaxID=1756392 RepID=UPI003393A7E7
MSTIRMFINGQALSGGSLHHALDGGTLLGAALTAPRYRFFSVRDEFPGLHPVTEGGVAVLGELYEVSYELLRESLLPQEPAELELGVIEMGDGTGSLAMRMRAEALGRDDVVDISDAGGWLAHLAAR